MSDAILERIATALEAIAKQGGKVGTVAAAAAGAAAGATPPKPAAAPPKPPAAGAKAPDKPAATPPKPAGSKPPAAAAASTKGPGGKYTSEQVRDVIRKVATNPALGKQSAMDVLDQDGGGVTNVTNLKPELFDAVYEACAVLLAGDGAGEAPAEDEFDPTA